MENNEWLRALKRTGPEQEQVLAQLRTVLIRGLHAGLSSWASRVGREFDALVEDFVQEALLKIIANIDSFRGESKFTTWASKIAVRIALTELRRKRWQNVSLEGAMENTESMPPMTRMKSRYTTPEVSAERADLMQLVKSMMNEELSEKQMTALNAVVFAEIPLEEVARRMGTNRNALYKLLHDARLRMKQRLSKEGMSPTDLLASFGNGAAHNH